MPIVRGHVMVVIHAFNDRSSVQQSLIPLVFKLAGIGLAEVCFVVAFLFLDIDGIAQPEVCLGVEFDDVVP